MEVRKPYEENKANKAPVAKIVYRVEAARPDRAVIHEVADRLRKGEVGVIPTETVYGLVALMSLSKAVERLYFIKGREKTKACAVGIWEPAQVKALTPEVTDTASWLMETFWPGPLTLVFKANQGIPAYVSRGLGTIGVRYPDHEVASAVMRELQEPLVMTSANRSGESSPYLADRVDLDDLDFLVDAGEADLRRESTVIDVAQEPATVLRTGVITPERLQEFGVVV